MYKLRVVVDTRGSYHNKFILIDGAKEVFGIELNDKLWLFEKRKNEENANNYLMT